MGGYHSFFIESKLFQLVIEEEGRYFSLQIFERGKYSMRSVFMGKNVAQWLRKKSRMLCIKEGDNNTKFFHKMANSHRRYNHLSFLEVDGVIYEEGAEAAAQVVQF